MRPLISKSSFFFNGRRRRKLSMKEIDLFTKLPSFSHLSPRACLNQVSKLIVHLEAAIWRAHCHGQRLLLDLARLAWQTQRSLPTSN
ncbi:unnamed protein product [Dovyalis caffra]|uniref:Uncharacterized protein n=1 Tax=Dovyalis caffra TaxID=77055 RepID=A0AAV1SSK1_9ROSI|nr:unnamed protein product [Dovyalis caffra]